MLQGISKTAYRRLERRVKNQSQHRLFRCRWFRPRTASQSPIVCFFGRLARVVPLCSLFSFARSVPWSLGWAVWFRFSPSHRVAGGWRAVWRGRPARSTTQGDGRGASTQQGSVACRLSCAIVAGLSRAISNFVNR